MTSNHLILCHPLLLLPSIFPSNRVFSNNSVLCIRWPKYWSFSFSISTSNEYSGLISFRIDWFDLLAVHRDTQESSPIPQFKSSWAPLISSLCLWIYLFWIGKWNHAMFDHLCLASFTSYKVFKAHADCGLAQSSLSFLTLNNILLCG